MRLNKANFAGLTSPGQQSEMKSILAGTWPPLKPLPVFKYETAEYRATIDFDKKRGEWACRKTSLPSNEVQELRGGLREITLALPHSETEIFTEGVEQQEPAFEREKNRRVQAIHDWREKYESGARYFELRDYLSESQRTELDDSLRLSLTARQLQFNPKNVSDVFEDLSVAGGRFAALIEFAKRNKANERMATQTQGDETATETEQASDENTKSREISSPEVGGALHSDEQLFPNPEGTESHTAANDFPALSIKDVFPDQEQTSFAEHVKHAASQHFEIETSEIVEADFATLAEHADQEERHSPAFTGLAAKVPAGQSLVNGEGADRIEGSPSRFLALKMSAFQVNVFAILLLFAMTSFIVGLTVGRGPLGKRLREPPNLIVANQATPPAPTEQLTDQVADQSDESSPRTPIPPLVSSADSADTSRPEGASPSEERAEEKPEKRPQGSEDIAEAHSADSDSSLATESKVPAKPEIIPERNGAIEPIVRNVSPPASPKPPHSRKAFGVKGGTPRRPAPFRPTSAVDTAPHLPRASTILVTAPGQGGQPIRVRFPERTIAATSSLAMTSQLSVLVFPELGPAATDKHSRLEAGDLVSFVWPHYPMPGNRYGLAETIRVRATIGQLGEVLEVKFLGGSASLLPATTGAIRQWRYRPTLLDKRPVEAQQDVTIEFRPPKYSSQLRTQLPFHN